MNHVTQQPVLSNESKMKAFKRSLRHGGGEARLRARSQSQGKFYSYRGFFLLTFMILSLWVMRAFLLPVLMGAIFATILYPLLQKMARWRVSTTLKSTILTLGFLFIFLVPVGILIALGSQTAIEAIQAAQVKAEQAGVNGWSMRGILTMIGADHWVDKIAEWLTIDEASIRKYMIQGLQKAAELATAALQGIIASLPDLFLSIFLILLTIFYLLIDGRRAVRFVQENSFFSPDLTQKMLSTLQSLCFSAVVASIVTGAVQTILLCAACLINGMHHVLFIALVTFMCSFLPMLGTAPVTLVLILQALAAGDSSGAIVFLVFGVIVSISDNIVRPWALRGGADMHPLLGFVSAFGGLEVMGFWGLFIGPVIVGFTFYILPIIARSYKGRQAA